MSYLITDDLFYSLRDLGVVWDADSIVIDNSVRIVPPYKTDNCVGIKSRGSPDGSVKQIKRLVCLVLHMDQRMQYYVNCLIN